MIVTGTNGTVYLVRLWSPTTTTGTFSICAFQNNPPPNDNPCGAIALTVNTGCIYPSPFTTEYATLTGSPGLPGCGGTPNDDVWFTAVVPASGQLQLSTDDFGITNAAMALYTGACGSLSLVAGSCQTGGTGMPQQTVALPAGTTVYIRVWREAGNAGTFLLCARNPLNPTGCYFTLNMADAAGDGWNGGFLTLDVGGVQTNYTVTGSTAFITFPATTGQVVTFSYTPAGGFQNQVSFNVLANNGFSLFASASPPLTGVNYGFTVNTTCNVPPSPISDCLGAFEVCSNQNINLAPSSGGNVDDLTAVNRGCLLGGETQGAWFRFRASVAGNLAFSINVTGGTDYDFAVWGPYSTAPTCIPLGPPGPPIRCSWSALPTSTGLNYTALDATEGAGGDAWVSDIPVALGDQFLLYVDNWTNNSTIFNLVWNNQPPNLLDCSRPIARTQV
ncbi:MAG: hypothetical protein IPG92_07060 [Flavobacteriales bacterium]|nr:hypothetical protein [Flavobacteriales bacterium]